MGIPLIPDLGNSRFGNSAYYYYYYYYYYYHFPNLFYLLVTKYSPPSGRLRKRHYRG